ncbi:unnamed protein product [Heligmosomoides polygyrus]|uniref:HTH_Tnp_Tc3_2 domain-containing protein n=1 Tax=Heligmosomoides polygyrus TaxID=6339 RepID=A0A183FKU9_HELPZ|nr:unnamed protein product [Heligmosomoides polygyrus]
MVTGSELQIVVRLAKRRIAQKKISTMTGINVKTAKFIPRQYRETSSVKEQPVTGRAVSAANPMMASIVQRRAVRNLRTSMWKMTRKVGVSSDSTRMTIRDVLGLRSLKLQEGNSLDDRIKKLRFEGCRTLHKRISCGHHASVLFTDRNLFTIERCLNHRIDRTLARTIKEVDSKGRLVTRAEHPASVRISWLPWNGSCSILSTAPCS